MDEKREREAWIRAERYVAGAEPRRRDPRTTLLELAERAPAVGEADRYGGGVSFYKDLFAPAGCALAGPADLIAEARVWLVRHGGRMFSAFPLMLAAERGLDEVLPRMPEYVAHARALAAALSGIDDASIVPDPPHAAMFHLYVKGNAERLNDAAVELAESSGTWLGAHFIPTANPTVAATELAIGDGNLTVAPEEAADLSSELVGLAA